MADEEQIGKVSDGAMASFERFMALAAEADAEGEFEQGALQRAAGYATLAANRYLAHQAAADASREEQHAMAGDAAVNVLCAMVATLYCALIEGVTDPAQSHLVAVAVLDNLIARIQDMTDHVFKAGEGLSPESLKRIN